MGFKRSNTEFGGVAFDAAAPSSGGAFVSSQLEIAMPEIIKPLVSSFFARDITVETGGGYAEFITAYTVDYGTSGANAAGLQGNANSDIPTVSANPAKVGWRVNNKKIAYYISYDDLQMMNLAKRLGMPMPYSIPQLLDEGVRLDRDKTLDYNLYLGMAGYPGLVNNPNVTAVLAAATGTGGTTTWATKTPAQILADINTVILSNLTMGVYDPAAIPNRILLPFSNLNQLAATMTTGGFQSILTYILENNLATKTYGVKLSIDGLPDPYIAAQGAGGTNRMVAYNDDARNAKMRLTVPLNKNFTLPTTRNGGGWETIFGYRFTPLMIQRQQTISYVDGI